MRLVRANMQTVRRLDSTLYGKSRVDTVKTYAEGEGMFNFMRGFYAESVRHTDDGIYVERIEQAERRTMVFKC